MRANAYLASSSRFLPSFPCPWCRAGGVVMRRIGLKDCPYCGSTEVYRSQPKTLADSACIFLLVRLVRCHDCMCRHYRPLFLPAYEYVTPFAKKPIRLRTDDDKLKRSA